MVVGESIQLAGGVRLYLQWRGPFLGVMSRITSLVVVWGYSPVLLDELLCHCGNGLLLSCGIGLLSSSRRDISLVVVVPLSGAALLTKWRNGPNSLSLSRRHGPRMKELGPMILTCSFLSSAELTEKNIKVLIVLERSMRRHKAFCSCAQKIIHKVNH